MILRKDLVPKIPVCACARPQSEQLVGECWLQSARVARKARHHQTAFNALLNGENTHLAELFTEKAKWLWSKVDTHTHTNTLTTPYHVCLIHFP